MKRKIIVIGRRNNKSEKTIEAVMKVLLREAEEYASTAYTHSKLAIRDEIRQFLKEIKEND